MAYDEETAKKIRLALSARSDVVEKPIVGGGLGFMVAGHLCCGLSSRGLTVRVGPDAKDFALSLPNVRPLAFGDRETAAFIVVDPEGYEDEDDLRVWVERGLDFIHSSE